MSFFEEDFDDDPLSLDADDGLGKESCEENLNQAQFDDVYTTEVINKVIHEKMPQVFAAKQLDVSVRQVQRMVQRYREHGPDGLRHRLKGRPSNNRRLIRVKEEAVNLIKNVYVGAGPTYGAEMLEKRHNIIVSPETLRQWCIEANLWEPCKKGAINRRRRERKSCLGELIQMDTCDHRWLEPVPEKLYLIASKDDASNMVFARFYTSDSTATNMDFMKRYIEHYGRPLAFYIDRASHFIVNPKKDKKVFTKEFETQIQRAMKELDVDLIHAGSAQAKGRIEREFRTLQDRLLKVMKWDNIKTLEEANEYLKSFLPEHNKRFMVNPKQPWNLHRPSTGFDLDSIFSIQETRKVSNDNVVRFDNKFYQLLVGSEGPSLRGKDALIEVRLNGNIKIRYGGKYYNYHILEC